ncbi:site-specific recombinase XerD [Paenarthrobacter nicotinovorans]|uniref:tyrosine-type recombinase/integrase n=1 Tax=Paenarthrobacter nicotinovorans TaxID=29320 RepID=UPI0027862BD7|nr:site-specific integrase [Paenarthrobacter nicotinovorans]MDP9936915.1 site-specific recombinase XerD [Paenarthrobacter nicotinovorans]
MNIEPGRIPAFLNTENIGLLRAEDRVFEAMLDGWRAQMLARGLSSAYIKSSCSVVERFQEHANEYPWTWSAHHVDEFFADRRSSEKGLALSTLRSNAGAIKAFCAYLTDGRYEWAAFCERVFADIPVQVVFEWNSPRHTADDTMPPRRRAFTRAELQTFFDVADDVVDTEFAKRSKRWLPALRDSTAFKVAYEYGLRRRELTMLEYVDFGPNPHVEQFGRFGALQVRWAKGTKGSGPRRRTVLTVPEFDWVVGQLEYWLSPDGRKRFATADRSASMWPSERSGSTVYRNFDRSFQRIRKTAGLPEELSLHTLRHSYVTHLIEAGYDPLFIQQQVGHSYSSTTALYTSVSADFKQKTIQKMIAQRLRGSGTDEGNGPWLNSDGSATDGTFGR